MVQAGTVVYVSTSRTMNPPAFAPDWDERASAATPLLKHNDGVFESFFERSFDAVWLFDPEAGVFVDCNHAAVQLIGAESKEQLLQARPEDISPSFQPNGASSNERTAQIIALVEQHKGHRFEWVIRHMAGHEIPLEVSCTPVQLGGRNIYIVISRDISERKKAEQESRELNQSLERRVTRRTAALSTSEARFRAMVEHATRFVGKPGGA
jgi:PAS domain S-box-containing protein